MAFEDSDSIRIDTGSSIVNGGNGVKMGEFKSYKDSTRDKADGGQGAAGPDESGSGGSKIRNLK